MKVFELFLLCAVILFIAPAKAEVTPECPSLEEVQKALKCTEGTCAAEIRQWKGKAFDVEGGKLHLTSGPKPMLFLDRNPTCAYRSSTGVYLYLELQKK